MNTRRHFLKALGAMATGVYLAPSITFDFPFPDAPINWSEWHFIEYKWSRLEGLRAFVDGRDVSGFREVMQKVCGLVSVEKDQVRFSSFGTLQEQPNGGFRLSLPDLDGEQPIVVAFQYKETGAGELRDMALDDVYLDWDQGKSELVPNDAAGEGLSIQALIPRPEAAWVPSDPIEVDEVAAHGSLLYVDSFDRVTEPLDSEEWTAREKWKEKP